MLTYRHLATLGELGELDDTQRPQRAGCIIRSQCNEINALPIVRGASAGARRVPSRGKSPRNFKTMRFQKTAKAGPLLLAIRN